MHINRVTKGDLKLRDMSIRIKLVKFPSCTWYTFSINLKKKFPVSKKCKNINKYQINITRYLFTVKHMHDCPS